MALAPIPVDTAIVDKGGTITIFFRQRWEDLRTLLGFVAARGIFSATLKTAAILGQYLTSAQTTGLYRVTFTARRLIVDGVASTLTFTAYWTDGAVPQAHSFAVDAVDTTGDLYTGTLLFTADGGTPLTFDMAYTSNTPAKMAYDVAVVAEQVVQV